MPTSEQDNHFATFMNDSIDATMSRMALDNAIEWIRTNLDVDDVFEEKEIKDWAENNGYKKEESI